MCFAQRLGTWGLGPRFYIFNKLQGLLMPLLWGPDLAEDRNSQLDNL